MNDSIIHLLRSFALRHYPQRISDFLDALTAFPGNHLAALAQALADEDDEVRLLAAEILYSMGNEAEPALPALIRSLNDEDRIVRIAAVYAVVNFGHKAIAAVPILESWLPSDEEFSEVTAAAAIAQIDSDRADDVLPILINALESSYGIQCHASWSLGQLGSVARGAVPALRWLLDDLSNSGDEIIKSLVVDAIDGIVGQDP